MFRSAVNAFSIMSSKILLPSVTPATTIVKPLTVLSIKHLCQFNDVETVKKSVAVKVAKFEECPTGSAAARALESSLGLSARSLKSNKQFCSIVNSFSDRQHKQMALNEIAFYQDPARAGNKLDTPRPPMRNIPHKFPRFPGAKITSRYPDLDLPVRASILRKRAAAITPIVPVLVAPSSTCRHPQMTTEASSQLEPIQLDPSYLAHSFLLFAVVLFEVVKTMINHSSISSPHSWFHLFSRF